MRVCVCACVRVCARVYVLYRHQINSPLATFEKRFYYKAYKQAPNNTRLQEGIHQVQNARVIQHCFNSYFQLH